jgi:thioredoxin-dependent peroxiredoxin
VQILGISFDTVPDNAAFAQKFGFPFPLLCDVDRKIGLAYGACESSADESAKRITYVIGPDGKITHAFGKVNAAQHPEEILTML